MKTSDWRTFDPIIKELVTNRESKKIKSWGDVRFYLVEEYGFDTEVKAYAIKRRAVDRLGIAENPFEPTAHDEKQAGWSTNDEKKLVLAYAEHGNDWTAVAKEMGGGATASSCNSRWGHLLARKEIKIKGKEVYGPDVKGFEICFDWDASMLYAHLNSYIADQDEFTTLPKHQILSQLSLRWFGQAHILGNAVKSGPFLSENQYLLDRLKLGKQLARLGVFEPADDLGMAIGEERELSYKGEVIATLDSGLVYELEEWCASTEGQNSDSE